MTDGPDRHPRSAPVDAGVLLRQVRQVGNDLAERTGALDESVMSAFTATELRAVRHVHVIGCGDSFHAGLAAGMAFRRITGLGYSVTSGGEFVDYFTAAASLAAGPGPSVVVGVSASGRTPAVVDALQMAGDAGALTVAVTGGADSPVADVAGRTIAAAVPTDEPSPGIRTFSASVLALLLVAANLAEGRSGDRGGSRARRSTFTRLAAAVDATNDLLDRRRSAVFDFVADAPLFITLGSGPSYGVACHAAAKFVEGAGVMGVARPLEEWRHVERFARPADAPVFVVAPPGRSERRAAEVVELATAIGRRVVSVAPEGSPAGRASAFVLPIAGWMAEEHSPLVYQLFGPHLAFEAASHLERAPFGTGGSAARRGPRILSVGSVELRQMTRGW